MFSYLHAIINVLPVVVFKSSQSSETVLYSLLIVLHGRGVFGIGLFCMFVLLCSVLRISSVLACVCMRCENKIDMLHDVIQPSYIFSAC